MKIGLSLLIAALAGCASTSVSSLYFPDLAQRVRNHEPQALSEVLVLSETTQPGEQLEELAEFSAAYVRSSPTIFLQAQSARPDCFGVSFLGSKFVDDDAGRAAELAARREALHGVIDPALAAVRDRCLLELHGS